MPTTPTGVYLGGLPAGTLARQWRRDVSFVRGLIASGKLATDERGLAKILSLLNFYRTNPHPPADAIGPQNADPG